MAQGEAQQSIEVSDGNPIDRDNALGSSSLHTIDSRAIELLEQIKNQSSQIIELLQYIAEKI